MAIFERDSEKTAEPSKPAPIPRDVDDRLRRGRKQMLRDAPARRLCMRFERGDTYWYINEKGILDFQSTTTSINGSGKPRHRVRAKTNFIRPIVEAKVSAATQRIPSYDVAPSTTDPKDEGAARMSEQVALYGYDKWMLRRAAIKTVKLAIAGGGDGFALPYFDPDVGPYVQMEDGKHVGQGEIKVLVLSGNEVYWEAGVDFYQSSWYAVERAQPLDEVKRLPGYVGGVLSPDATTSDIPTDVKDRDNLVMVTDYYERPCPRYPSGRVMHFANGRVITDARMLNPTARGPWEDYPLKDGDGKVLDEPILHRLSYTVDPETDHDLGLVWQLIDLQRTAQDAHNKCVSAETPVITDKGVRLAGDLSGTVNVLAGDGQFRPAEWAPQGEDRLWRVTFDDGTTTYATANHRWVTRAFAKDAWTRTPDLKGYRVPVSTLAANTPVADEEDWLAGIQNGLMWGDGTVENHRRGDRVYTYGSIRQYGAEDNLALVERFFPDSHTERREYDGLPWIQARNVDPDLKALPALDLGLDYLRGFLAGAIASDGTVSSRGTVSIAQKSREVLEAVAEIARTVGIAHRPISQHVNPDGATWHTISLDTRSFAGREGVDETLLLKPYHRTALQEHVDRRVCVRVPCRGVVSVEPTDRVEQTYCCHEPVTNTWTLGNGLVTGNSVEWKNRCLMPQIMAPLNSIVNQRTDIPGDVIYYRSIGGMKPEWEQVPPIPDSLFRIKSEAKADMQYIAADVELDAQGAAKTQQQLIEQSANRWQAFLGDLAEWHSRLMRHCLLLVARHYTEPRLLQIRGRFGPYPISDFQGAHLMGQVNVTVLPGSLQVRTKEQITQQVLAFADRGWVSPQVAMAAIQGGTAEKLIEGYELDVARANRIIQSIVDGSVMEMGTWQVTDPLTGQPSKQPIFMPRESDNLEIWKSVFGDWLKTEQYQALPPEGQEATNLIYSGILTLETQAQQKALEAQNAAAMQQGAANAAKPQEKGMPDMPGGTTDQAAGPPPAAAM